jgi:hypothetical protein
MASYDLTSYFMSNANHKQGMPKGLLKDMVMAYRNRLWECNDTDLDAEMNMALFIMSGSMMRVKQHNGQDYGEHPIRVGFNKTGSYVKRMIGVLHDVVEDTDWTLQDLKNVGFSKRVIDGVDGVTLMDGESYFAFIERCGKNPDSIDVKLADLDDNSDLTRSAGLADFDNPRDARMIEKQRQVYATSYHYLVAIKRGKIEPGTPVATFMHKFPQWKSEDLLKRWGTPKP